MPGPNLDILIDKLKITQKFDFSEIEKLKVELIKTTMQNKNLNFAALEYQRRQGSNTLKDQKELAAWTTANNQIMAWIQAESQLSFENIKQINQILNPEGLGKIRTQPIFAGLGEFINPQHLMEFENLFQKNILEKDLHPILKAAQTYQWICSFHLFENANGRTARIAADYFLMQNDYLPLSFENPFDAMVGIKSNTIHIDGNYGVDKTIKWLKNSYQIIYL